MDSEGARNLAAAIIATAAKDLINARERERRYEQNVKQIEAEGDRKECIRFFNSHWYETLCDIVGVNADEIRQEVTHGHFNSGIYFRTDFGGGNRDFD